MIVGILLAVGVTAFSGSTVNCQTEAAADRVASDLSLARQHAITTGASQSVQFTPGTGGYALPGMEDPDRPSSTYGVDLSGPPYRVAIQSADFDGDAEIVFDAYGKPDSGGTLVIGAGERQITLSVDGETGRVSRP